MPLISGLGFTPITQDRIVICISGVPISGITVIAQPQRGSSSSGIVNLWDLPASITSSRRFPLPTGARHGGAEVTVAQAVENDLANLVERVAKLRAAGGLGGCVAGFFKHCAAAPSCP